MNRLKMLEWIHETLGEFKDPSLLNISTPHKNNKLSGFCVFSIMLFLGFLSVQIC